MQPGDIIADRFEISGLVGGGAMGVVFRAHDHRARADVAVKVLRDAHGDARRFTREAEVLAELSHPHVVRYVAHGVTPQDEAYLVMEWIEGEDVARRLGRGRLRVEAALTLGARVAAALAEAHARGVVHRDVKPSNLLLPGGDVGRVKVMDFGIARVSGLTRATQTGAVLGTPGYMPPEQARGEDALDPRADVFSLGCVLFECLTGAPAFAGRHLPAVLAKILFEPAPHVRALHPEVPAALDRLVDRMLDKEVSGRPASAEVARELEALAELAGAVPPGDMTPPVSVRSITRDEQRVLSVVMIGAAPGAGDVEPLRAAAEARGARLERMADGSMAATLREALPPADEAAQAARLARDLCRAAPARPIVVATSRSGGLWKRTVGDAINRAASLLEAASRAGAPTGAPLVDEASARLLDKRFELSPSPSGLAIVGELDPHAMTRTLQGKRTPLVGRRAELGMLTTLLTESASESVARAALVTGSSGYGKSRLAEELLLVARREVPGATVWTARGDALRAGAVFALLADALRGAAGLRPGDPPEARRERLGAYVAARVAPGERTRVTEFLGELLGVPFSDDESPALFAARNDVRLMREQMVRAFADLLRAECAARPVILVLDDLQWGDAASVRCVGMALATLRDAPFFVLGLGRPEVPQTFPKLWEDEGVVSLRLKELTRKAGAELVEHALGERATPALVDRLVKQADGHALYLEELIRAAGEGREDTSPETALALVDARLSALAPEVRRVLRAAAVFGDACWSGGVAALCADEGASTTLRHLDALVKLEILAHRPESRFPGEVEYAFRHALLREGAYAQLTDADRTLGHGLAGEWLAAHGEPGPLVLAEHFARAGGGARAGHAFARAAELAFRAGDAEAAIRHARRGLALDLPDELRGELLGVLCEAYVWRFDWDTAASLVEEALRLARPGSLPWIHAATAQLWLSAEKGAFDAVPAQVERLSRVAVDADAVTHASFSLGLCVFALDVMGRFDLSQPTLERLGEMVAPVAGHDLAARGWLEFARAHAALFVGADPWRGLCLSRAAVASFQDAASARGLAVAMVGEGMCLWRLGAFEEAERTLRGAVVDWDLGDFALLRDYFLGCALLDRGAQAAAEDAGHALLTRALETRSRRFEGRSHGLLASAALRRGDVARAEREVTLALDRTPAALLYHLVLEVKLAAIRLAGGRAAEALDLAEAAFAAAEARRFHRLTARVVRAEALAATGARDRAREALVEARALLLTRADQIGPPALRKSFLDRVAENARLGQLCAALLPDDEPTTLPSRGPDE